MPALVVFIILALGAILFASFYFARDRRARRRLASTPVLPIAAITPGTTARLTGKIEYLDGELVAPLSGRTCVYYLVTVQEYRSSGKSGRWVEILREEKHVDFLVRDGTGLARIHMDRPNVVIVRDHNSRSGTFDDATAIEAAFLERFSTSSTNFLGLNRSLRYSEGALEFAETITVLGAARASEGEVSVMMGATPEEPLLLTDHPDTVAASPRLPA